MCLSKVDKGLAEKYKGCTTGWKIFNTHLRPGILLNECQGEQFTALPVGTWLKEQDYRKKCKRGCKYIYGSSRYPYGFHVFLTEQDAIRWGGSDGLRQVGFRKPVAWGLQGFALSPVVVAQEIKILPL